MKALGVYSVENFFSIEKPLDCATEVPFGISMILTGLESGGHEVDLLVLTSASPVRKMLDDELQRFRPQMLCLTAVSTQYPLINDVARIAKEIDPTLFIILGGHHASLQPEDAILNPSLDAICVGEGDRAIVALADQLSAGKTPSGISGLWIKSKGGDRAENIEKNPQDRFLDDLDQLPFINRKLWSRWIFDESKMPSVLVGRGCPYRCTYCSNHAMQKLAKGKYVRFRSTDHLIAEIAAIVTDNPKVEDIYLEVETIGVYPEYCLELGAKLLAFNNTRKRPLSFGANIAPTKRLLAKPDLLDEILGLFHKAGVRFLNIGLESGSERMRKEVLKRPDHSNPALIDFCLRARSHGIDINLFILFGLPTETPAEYLETVQVARACKPNRVYHSIFYPYPGTDLHHHAMADGLITKDILINNKAERSRPVLNSQTFPRSRVIFEYIVFPIRCYHGDWPIGKIAFATIKNLISIYPGLYAWARRFLASYSFTKAIYTNYKAKSFIMRQEIAQEVKK
ncbi:MAG: B12-binding domain-containing radical SAM protein [Nitrospirae bacterium]|nr:B12-binding domain-containing radical SAM protein [Magnetococcales bacterium]HAT48778.1 hypothetical protein [Alphaproteobacteria bacterium]